jgi:hypothetical protein
VPHYFFRKKSAFSYAISAVKKIKCLIISSEKNQHFLVEETMRHLIVLRRINKAFHSLLMK